MVEIVGAEALIGEIVRSVDSGMVDGTVVEGMVNGIVAVDESVAVVVVLAAID